MNSDLLEERVAIGLRAAEPFADRVEQNQRELLHVRRMRLLHVTARRELRDRSGARFAWIGDCRRDASGFEEQTFANAVA